MVFHKNKKTQLPVVRLKLAYPFLAAAQDAIEDVDAILADYGLNKQAFENEGIFVPAPTMYAIVEALAEATNDPYIGIRLGMQLDPLQWSPLKEAAKHAKTVGDLLLRFSINAYEDANSVTFKLETQGTRTTFSEVRLSDGRQRPRQNDAFSLGYILSILQTAVGPDWDGRQVVAQVCDPDAVPRDYLNIRVAAADTLGISLSFPCTWLLLDPSFQSRVAPEQSLPADRSAPDSTLSALHHVLETNLHRPELDAEHVAKLCGMSKRTLSRRLSNLNTSLKAEMTSLKRQRAENDLISSELPISDIGARVGYVDATVFCRAFKRWHGMTPSTFRKKNRVVRIK
jgi:AraC-like DNA-binding protein